MPKAGREPVDAEAIARKHPAVDALRKRRGRAVLVRPKPPHRGEAEDESQVVVGFFDYEENKSVVALVDADAKEVLAVEEVPVSFQLSEEERLEAETLAAGDARVTARLGGRGMTPLTRLFFPRNAAPEVRAHRYAIVFLRPTDRERYYAVVDLSARKVVDVLTRNDLTGR
jgi:hypothetical protein